MTDSQVTLETAAEHFGVAPGEEFVLNGYPNAEPGQRYRLIKYDIIQTKGSTERGLERLNELGVPATIPIAAHATMLEAMNIKGLGVVERGTKFCAFPAEFIRVPGIQPDGPALCAKCGEPGTIERKVRFHRADGLRMHADCREGGDTDGD